MRNQEDLFNLFLCLMILLGIHGCQHRTDNRRPGNDVRDGGVGGPTGKEPRSETENKEPRSVLSHRGFGGKLGQMTQTLGDRLNVVHFPGCCFEKDCVFVN